MPSTERRIELQSKPAPVKRSKAPSLRRISLSDPVLVDFAYKLAVLDSGVLRRDSRQELAIRRQIRDVYPKVTESVQQIADMTVYCVQELEKMGVPSSNYELLRAVNLAVPADTRRLWPMQYAELSALIVTLSAK